MLLIVALILLFILPDPWNLIGFFVAIAAFLVELYLWNRTVRRRRKVVGPQTLVGQIAEVRTACLPYGQVFVAGELWAARCEEGADAGTQVKVARVRGLTLEVEPVS
jgi:membrane-bound serine protease (ClpP class)